MFLEQSRPTPIPLPGTLHSKKEIRTTFDPTGFDEWRRDDPIRDDITLLGVEYRGAP
jgi:hypothetical protein